MDTTKASTLRAATKRKLHKSISMSFFYEISGTKWGAYKKENRAN